MLYYVHVSSHPILCSYLSYLPNVILVQSNLSWQIWTSAMADAECKMQNAQMHNALPQYYFWNQFRAVYLQCPFPANSFPPKSWHISPGAGCLEPELLWSSHLKHLHPNQAKDASMFLGLLRKGIIMLVPILILVLNWTITCTIVQHWSVVYTCLLILNKPKSLQTPSHLVLISLTMYTGIVYWYMYLYQYSCI